MDDPIWYFLCLCRKFSKLRALLFLSSTQTSQNLKFIQKCPCLSSLKNKFQWTQINFWPLIRKILLWTFWDYKSSWSKKSTPIQPQGVIGAPPTMYFQKMQFLGVFRPFLQRSLNKPMKLNSAKYKMRAPRIWNLFDKYRLDFWQLLHQYSQ